MLQHNEWTIITVVKYYSSKLPNFAHVQTHLPAASFRAKKAPKNNSTVTVFILEKMEINNKITCKHKEMLPSESLWEQW